jgi:parvulin-like peptidyl-prolyl isomerase
LNFLKIIAMRVIQNKRVGRFFLWAAILALACAGPGCGSKKKASAPSSLLDLPSEPGPVILQVGSAAYRTADFVRYVDVSIGPGGRKLGTMALSQLFDEFVDDKLLLQAAVNDSVTLTPEEKGEFLKKLREDGWTAEEESAALSSEEGPLSDRLKVEKYIFGLVKDVTVTDDEVSTYYEQNKSRFFLPERIKVSQIMLPTEPAAVEVWEGLRGGSEDDFRAAAKARSVSPEAAEGGLMGVFQKGQLPAEMEASVFSLQEGEISPVVRSSYGFHIFRVDKKYAAEEMSLEDASASIRLDLLDQKVKAIIARRLLDLRESLDWTALPENLPFAYQRVKS